MRILFALLSALTGLLLVFGGYRLARVIIPLWGFVAGISLGGAVAADMNGTPFLGTALGIFVGLVLGVVFAVFAYLYYSLAVVILAGSLGYWAGSSFIVFLGLNRGVISAFVGLALGVVVGIAALLFNAPKYVLIVLTAIAGSVITVGGFLLLINKIPFAQFSYSSAKYTISHSAIWSIVMLILAIVGIIAQNRSTKEYELEAWSMTNHGHHPTTHSPQMQH